MPAIQLTALPDDSLDLEGDVTILDRDGRAFAERGAPVYLCRCGRSADEPCCDGSHVRTGWKEDA